MAKTRPQTSSGPSQRQLRVAEVIRRALSEILARGDLHEPELEHVSITVAEVRTSTDLRHATAFVLPLGGVNTEEVLKALTRSRHELRRMLASRIELKYSPELSFQPDTSFDQMDRTRDLLGLDAVRRDLDAD
jgi:ribosome-binding factor A